ncbi:RNA 2',3'-cyclic phosphodiesterase [Pararhodobacter sp. SW119]|uniref:RNA 2',3'-cyclic phosphodiesterase n=1 Tax=Pararhodobacter sp. SW119 TaxID=2780075 RepID=UPI001AE0CDC6|nr:RNA 2',3'-cyclic phosphodiesterase [Pararhodobacter sp. SW119]
MIRAFIALPLPAEIRSQLAVTQFLLPLPRPVPPANMHVTLAFLGEVPEAVLEEADTAFAALRAAPLTLSVSGLGVFGGEKPRNVHASLAPSPALDHLQGRIVQAARRAGIRVAGRRFVPHVTLGRMSPGQVGAHELAKAFGEIGAVASPPFTVAEFALYRSILRADGPVYDVLAEYPLGG